MAFDPMDLIDDAKPILCGNELGETQRNKMKANR